MLLTFVSLYLTYHTAEVDAIVFSLGAGVLAFVSSKRLVLKNGPPDLMFFNILGLTAAFILIFTTFDRVFYGFLPDVTGSVITGGLSVLLLSNYNT